LLQTIEIWRLSSLPYSDACEETEEWLTKYLRCDCHYCFISLHLTSATFLWTTANIAIDKYIICVPFLLIIFLITWK
jgi:hypothetical protein